MKSELLEEVIIYLQATKETHSQMTSNNFNKISITYQNHFFVNSTRSPWATMFT